MSANPLSGVTTNLTHEDWLTGTLPATPSAKIEFPDSWTNVNAIFDIWLQVGDGVPYNSRIYNPAAAATAAQFGAFSNLTTQVSASATAPAIVINAQSSTNHTLYFVKSASGDLMLQHTTGTAVAVKFWIKRILFIPTVA